MKVFKIILILVLLFSMNCYGTEMMALPVFEDGVVTGVDFDVAHDTLIEPVFPFIDSPTEDSITPYCQFVPMILLEWFKDLTLDEKVEIYNWWKNGSVDWTENCIEMPLVIEEPEEKIKRYITRYAEHISNTWLDDFGTIDIEILNIEPHKMDSEKDKIERLIGIEYIDSMVLSDNKIRVNIWVDADKDSNAIRRLREIKNKLRENGFVYGK